MPIENTAAMVEGRLLQIHVAAGYRSVADVDDMSAKLVKLCAGLPVGAQVVIAADWRPCQLFTPEVAARIPTMMNSVRSRILRSAILHQDGQATTVLQLLRLIREANFPDRKVFTEIPAMESFLGEVLNSRESHQLKLFLQGKG